MTSRATGWNPIAVVLLAGIAALGGSSDARSEEQKADPFATSTKTCQAVVNDNVKAEFPKAKGIAWDLEAVTQEEVTGNVHYAGTGAYRGDTGKKRTFEFECVYDSRKERVVQASWTSSFDRRLHVVVDEMGDGPDRSEITKACRGAVEEEVGEGFPTKIKGLDLIQDSLERSQTGGRHSLAGQGRFQGGGGNWHRFVFTCTFDEGAGDDGAGEVVEVSWRHLGDEKDLDD